MSATWTKRAVTLYNSFRNRNILLTEEITFLGPRGCAVIRFGPVEPWKYFGLTAVEFMIADSKGLLPDPKSICNTVVVGGYSEADRWKCKKEFLITQCPRAILGKLVDAGILTHHDAMEAYNYGASQ